MVEVCLVNKLIQIGEFCIFLNEVLNWLVTVSLNIIFKLYSEGAIQFLKYILSNPFKSSAAIQTSRFSGVLGVIRNTAMIEMSYSHKSLSK